MKRLVVEDELGEEAKVLEKDRALAAIHFKHAHSITHARADSCHKGLSIQCDFCLAVS